VTSMQVGVVIAAGGRGSRIGGAVPKQLLEVGGRSVLQRSLAAFDDHPAVSELVVVLPESLLGDGPALAGDLKRTPRFVAGGARRQDSVANGVAALGPDVDVVLVHDAARPFVSPRLIDRVIDAAVEAGAAVPALPVRDTVKRADGLSRQVRMTIPREEIWLAQTPQGFRRDVLTDAIARVGAGVDATDEGMLAELAGHPVRIVDGEPGNVKITTPEDLATARARFDGANARIGTGYDLHRLVPGRALVLAGVTVPFERGPLGHSDGDVVCHALVDAIFGAAALGDIGRHFPDTDARWKDAPGLDLLARAVEIVRAAGWVVANADVTVILERPKLAPHIDEIRTRVASAAGVSLDHVSVKAKTNEGVDATGRGEAIAAHAVALLAARPGQL
jgi:2-C-methyl-D-erythritol 4-phosphate cytidylyltransferase/2-C-methyl-D-erythritol 2,4-cyclodiphosphate synthase